MKNIKVLEKEDIKLIKVMFKIAQYKSWDNKEGDKKAEELCNKWHKQKRNYGIFAMAIDLQTKLEELKKEVKK
jgi:hypothetical protein